MIRNVLKVKLLWENGLPCRIKTDYHLNGKITEWTSRQPTEFRKRAPIGLHGTKNLNITVSLFWEIPPIYGLKNKTTPTCLLVPSYLKHNKQIRHFSNKKNVVKKEKKSLKEKIKDELRHYYHGFKLLNLNVKVSRKLVYRTLKGENLTRRERKLLTRTIGDLFKLIPFSAFIFVPFLEFTLPIFLVFFPGMLPSTFETDQQKENKIKKKFQVQLAMAKVLQDAILKNVTVYGKGHVLQEAIEFSEVFEKVRQGHGSVSTDELMKFCRLFRDEITLSSLPRPQVVALCKVLGIRPIGTTGFLRRKLEMRMIELRLDDELIYKEGVNELSSEELQYVCQARGMPVLDVTEEKLRKQLAYWLELSIQKDVPPSLLLLSQVFMFPSSVPTEKQLATAIQSLPKEVVTATTAEIHNIQGKMDYKTECDYIKDEMDKIEQERKESIPLAFYEKERVNCQNDIECALCSVLKLEELEIHMLKQSMRQHEEEEKKLKEIVHQISVDDVQDTKNAQLLKEKLNNMIDNLDRTLSKIEAMHTNTHDQSSSLSSTKIKVSEIIKAINSHGKKMNEESKEKIYNIINKLDKNKDGTVEGLYLLKLTEVLNNTDTLFMCEEEIVDLVLNECETKSPYPICKSMITGAHISDIKKELQEQRARIIEDMNQVLKKSASEEN